jgi:hypothetical protein
VDQVSVSDIPCDFVRTTGGERADTRLGNVWRQTVGLTGVRAVAGNEGVPGCLLQGTPLGTGGSAQLLQAGTSLAGTLQLNTGTTPANTGGVAIVCYRTMYTPVILVSLEDGAAAWGADAQVRVTVRDSGTAGQFGFIATWRQTANLTASTSNCVRINYWIVELSNLGIG